MSEGHIWGIRISPSQRLSLAISSRIDIIKKSSRRAVNDSRWGEKGGGGGKPRPLFLSFPFPSSPWRFHFPSPGLPATQKRPLRNIERISSLSSSSLAWNELMITLWFYYNFFLHSIKLFQNLCSSLYELFLLQPPGFFLLWKMRRHVEKKFKK